MVLVPVHVLDRQVVAALGLQLGAGLALGAAVDGALLGAYQEFLVARLGAEVEAGGCRLAGDGGLVVLGGVDLGLLVIKLDHVDGGFLLVRTLILQLELHNDLAFELALDHAPGTELAVTGYRLEAAGTVGIPADLPDWVVVFATLH